MASEVGDLYVILRAITEPFNKAMKQAALEGEATSTRLGGAFDKTAAEGEASSSRIGGAFRKLSTIGVGAGIAAAAISLATVKWASDFETQMTRVYTAAGLTQDQLKAAHMTTTQLDDAVLQLGNQTGFTGTQMAEALYHPISASLDLKSALGVVKYAAEEARISGASLDDTTYSLSSVMKAFNLSADEAGPTMAKLNAIVGQGDMKFQDFNTSIKNWAPTAAQLGIGIDSMGAGLAYLTDRGNSAEEAATRMTMGLSMMTTPSKKATELLVGMGLAQTDVKASSDAMTEVLKKTGITQNQLAEDLKKPDGLYVALTHLKTGLKDAGISGTEADSVLAKIFGGGRSDKAIMSLFQNLDGVKGKYDDIEKAANMGNFNDAFTKTQQTFSAKLKDLEATLVNLGIKLGTALLPYVEKFIGWLQRGIGWLTEHKGAVIALAGAIGTTLVAAIVGLGVSMVAAFGWVDAIVLGVMAVGAGVAYAYSHFKIFRTVVDDVGRAIGTAFKAAWQAAGAVVDWFRTTVIPLARKAIAELVEWFNAHKDEFRKDWDQVLHDVEKLVKWFKENVLTWVQEKVAEFVKWWKDHSKEIHTAWHDVWDIVKTTAKVVLNLIGGFLREAFGFWSFVWGLISDSIKMVWGIISDVVTAGIHYVKNIIDFVLDLISGKWGKAWGDLNKLVSQAFSDIWKTITDLTRNFDTLLADAGKNLIKGLISGMKSMVSTLKSTVGDVVGGIKGFFNQSPAKEGPLAGTGGPDYMGATFGKMLADGMHSSVGVVSRASSALAGAASLTVGGGALPGLAAAGSYSSGGQTTVINVTVQGSVLSERDLRDVMEQQMYRLGMRNSQTWPSYQRR